MTQIKRAHFVGEIFNKRRKMAKVKHPDDKLEHVSEGFADLVRNKRLFRC